MIYNILLIIFASQANGFLGGLRSLQMPNPDEIIEGNTAKCEIEGAEEDLPFKSPCIKCFCQGGLVTCKKTKCPPMDDCKGIVVKKPGECCGQCQETNDCYDFAKRRQYKDGDRWFQHKCTECSCNKGSIKCDPQVCNPNLICPKGMKKGRSPGACCQSCIEETGMCTSFGDPHYQTFDNRMFNFQGKCKYVFAKDCDTENFSIHVKNEGRHSRTFSWTKSVFLHFNGIEVVLQQNLRVKVNGEIITPPYVRLPDLKITESDFLIKVVTSIGVELVWDGDSYTEVHIPKRYRNKTCGICGNFNGDQTDDFTMRDGRLTENKNDFAESWRIRGAPCEKEEIPNKGSYPEQCRGTDLINAHMKCSILKNSKFSECHQYVNPRRHYTSCIMDMCSCRQRSRDQSCMCMSLTAYARTCNLLGVNVKWRSKKICGNPCKGGAVYDDCGPACRLTCHNKDDANKVCLKPCVSGCHCPAGTVWHKRKCIMSSKCPKMAKKRKRAKKKFVH